jgi:hypothetical protein
MAHYTINRAAPAGGELVGDLRTLREVLARLNNHKLRMAQFIGGSDQAGMETYFGIAVGQGDEVKGEIDSAIGKITTDASVSGTAAALTQLFTVVG